MKRKAFSKFVVIGLGVWVSTSSMIFANTGSTKFFINGEERYDAEILMKNDTTYVPLRIVGEELGAKVNYDPKNKSILVSKDSTSLQMSIGDKETLLNGEPFSLSNEILMHPSTEGVQLTYIPLRNIFEIFDGVVEYNKEYNYVNAYNKDYLTYKALEGLKSEDLTTYRFAQLALPRVGDADMSLTGGRVVEYIFPVNTKTDYFFIRIDPSGDMDVTSIAYMEVENGVAICKWYKELNGEVKENINSIDNAINRSLGVRGVTREVGEFPDLEETNFIYFVEHNMMQPSPEDEFFPLYEEKFEGMIGILTPHGEKGITKNLIGEMRWSPYADKYIRQGYDGGMYTYWKNAILLSEVDEISLIDAISEDTTYLYGFIIPNKIINVKEEDLKDTSLPIVQWYDDWPYMGLHITDGKAGLSDESYKLENFLRLKYDEKIVQELMDKFSKEDNSKTEFNDNTYISFSRASDEARMVLIGYIN